MRRAFQQSPPSLRRGAAMLVDAVIVIESLIVALLFRFDGQVPDPFLFTFWPFALASAILFVVLLRANGVYQSILRYTGIYQGVRIASATSIATGLLFLADFGMGPEGVGLMSHNAAPLSVVLVGGVLAYLQLVAVRLYPRVFYELSLREIGRRKRTAPSSGRARPGSRSPATYGAWRRWRTRSSASSPTRTRPTRS